MNTNRIRTSSLVMLVASSGISQYALSNEIQTYQLEEVLVTAQKQSQSLQKTPVAVTALSRNDLDKLGVSSLDGLADSIVSSLRISPNGNATSTLEVSIRGNGPTDVGQITREGHVAIYQDGFYLGRAQGLSMELAEIERIEVLRGPQGTLFGRNATGGAIQIVTALPTGEFSIEQNITAGRFDDRRSTTRINTPEIKGVSAKIDYMYRKQDGWVRNADKQEEDYNAVEKQGGRLSVHWQANNTTTWDNAYENAVSESTQPYFQVYRDNGGLIGDEGKRQTKTRFPLQLEPTMVDIESHSLIGTKRVNDNITVKSLSAYRTLKEEGNNNWGGVLYANGVNLAEDVDQRQWSQEFQVLGDYEHLTWVAGAYAYRERSKQTTQLHFTLDTDGSITGSGIPFTPIDPPITFGLPATHIEAKTDSKGLYGQTTWKPLSENEKLQLSLGIRYTEDEKKGDRFQYVENEFSLDSEHWDGQAIVSYDWNDLLSTYLKWGSAYKAGGANTRSATFDPYLEMEVNTWEAGLKSEWFDRRVRVNAAIFRSRYNDMQFDFVDPEVVLVTETLNAQETVRVSGFELELSARPTESLTLGLSYTYLDGDMPLQPNPLDNGALTRFELHQTPNHAGAITVDYMIPSSAGVFIGHLAIRSTDQYAYASVINPRLDGYTLVDGRITLPSLFSGQDTGDLEVSIWASNILDEEYVVVGYPIGVPPITTVQAFGQPRTFGIDARFSL
jgi:iron complex outermembrane receptor protein